MQQKSYSKYLHMNASIYVTIVNITNNCKYYKTTIAKIAKTTMMANMTKKESSTVFNIVSIFTIVAMQ